METAIRWSPSSTLTSQKFLFADVLNRSFRLGTITSYLPDSSGLNYTFSPTYRNVPAFRALDWAPFNESLVAVGTPSGETSVLSIDDSAPVIKFPAKYQRPCNAVAFSNKGSLATGLEKVRSDYCLNVWDVNGSRGSDSTGASPTPPSGPRSAYVEPVRKYASSEAVSSIKFFGSQPDVLVVGVKGVGIRCYDTRDGTSNASLQFLTHCVHNIAIDPLNEVHFASAGPLRDTTIQIWDVRFGLPQTSFLSTPGKTPSFWSTNDIATGPIIAYEDVFNEGRRDNDKRLTANIWSLRYCKGKAGLLGALASNGDFRIFETQKAHMDLGSQSDESKHAEFGIQTKESIAPVFTKRIHRTEHAFDGTRCARAEKDRIISFDFTNLAGSEGQPTMIILRGNQSVDILQMRGPPEALDTSRFGNLAISKTLNRAGMAAAVANENELSVSLEESISFTYPAKEGDDFDATKKQWKELLQKSRGMSGSEENDVQLSSFEKHQLTFAVPLKPHKLSADEALSISTLPQKRCANGYGLDCKRNIEITSENPWLQEMWKWIDRAKTHASRGEMKTLGFDLSYLGVHRLWNQDLGYERNARRTSNTNSTISSAIKRLAKDLDLPNAITGRTSHPEHRQLCLHTSGYGLKEQQLAGEVIQLARGGQQTKAATLALMLGHHRLAATALRTGKLEPHHQALALAVGAYVKGNSDDSWNDVVQNVLQDVTEPYSRAIFAFVKRGSWDDVLKEVSLPLRERVRIALLHLSDMDLTRYIDESTTTAVKQGDIEGLILTGLTARAVTLLDAYVRKFSDLQTAVLAISHTSPLFLTNPLVESWRAAYRSWMNSWRMYTQRARFDVDSTKLSTPANGKSLLKQSQRQCSLACTSCEQALDRNTRDVSALTDNDSIASSFGSHAGSIFGDTKFGTVCPKCGKHMPRCEVCQHWLGMPDHETKYGKALAKTREQLFGLMTTFCQKCLHMTHVAHAEMWFADHQVCPKVDCNCPCWEGMAGFG